MLRLGKTSGTYKDFGKSFFEVWADAFHNYTTVLVSLFGKEAPDLHAALQDFYSSIYELSTVYEWQEAVLPMAIEAHTYIIAQQPTDPAKWVIAEKFQGRICTPRTMIGMGAVTGANKSKRSRSPLPARRSGNSSSNAGSNNPSVVCNVFNKGSYTWGFC